MNNEVILANGEIVSRDPMTIDAPGVAATMANLKAIRQFVGKEMVKDIDYGVIPGTSSKPVMLLPGAQKVCMLYNAYPRYKVDASELGNGHVEFRVTTDLVHRATDSVIASGLGSCSTMESKYRYRNAGRVCPKCGKDAIIKGKAEFGGGWLCFAKKGGCNAKFADNAPEITGQQVGRVENMDICDARNTVLKIAKKRSFVDASIGLGCLGELFTQDLEDEAAHDAPKESAKQQGKQSPPEDFDPAPEHPVNLDTMLAELETCLTRNPNADEVTKLLHQVDVLPDCPHRKMAYARLKTFVGTAGLKYDKAKNAFFQPKPSPANPEAQAVAAVQKAMDAIGWTWGRICANREWVARNISDLTVEEREDLLREMQEEYVLQTEKVAF
jgi:hypothetical protein